MSPQLYTHIELEITAAVFVALLLIASEGIPEIVTLVDRVAAADILDAEDFVQFARSSICPEAITVNSSEGKSSSQQVANRRCLDLTMKLEDIIQMVQPISYWHSESLILISFRELICCF
eukprot:gene1377-2651_t